MRIYRSGNRIQCDPITTVWAYRRKILRPEFIYGFRGLIAHSVIDLLCLTRFRRTSGPDILGQTGQYSKYPVIRQKIRQPQRVHR